MHGRLNQGQRHASPTANVAQASSTFWQFPLKPPAHTEDLQSCLFLLLLKETWRISTFVKKGKMRKRSSAWAAGRGGGGAERPVAPSSVPRSHARRQAVGAGKCVAICSFSTVILCIQQQDVFSGIREASGRLFFRSGNANQLFPINER